MFVRVLVSVCSLVSILMLRFSQNLYTANRGVVYCDWLL